MKVLFAIGYDLKRSPWATRPLSLAKELSKRGIEITILYQEGEKSIPVIHSIPENISYSELLWKMPSEKIKTLANLECWKYYIEMMNPEMLHVQKPTFPMLFISKAAKKMNLPLVYDWDDWEGSGGIRSGLKGIKTDYIDRWFAKNADWIVFSNKEIQKEAEKKYKRKDKYSLAPCGVDLNLFNKNNIDNNKLENLRKKLKIQPSEKVVVYHGQWEMGVDCEVLLNCIKYIGDKLPDVKFLLIGEGPKLKTFMESISTEELKERIITTGKIPYEEIPLYLSLSYLALAPFKDDFYSWCKSPLKLYEYLALGIPVITTRVGQAVDIINSQCGAVCEPSSGQEMGEISVQLLQDDSKRLYLGKNSMEKAFENHSWSKVTDIFEKVYSKLSE